MKKVNLLTLAKREQTQQPKVARWLSMIDESLLSGYEKEFVHKIKTVRVLTTKQMTYLRKLANGGYRGSMPCRWDACDGDCSPDIGDDMAELDHVWDQGSY